MSIPVIWSVGGHDSSGTAGLSADARAAQAFGVHLCPVAAVVSAVVTAPDTQGEAMTMSVGRPMLDAQLKALAQNQPPVVIKTGRLGDADQLAALARHTDQLRSSGRAVALVVDLLPDASQGAACFSPALIDAYQHQLLPRATLVTGNLGSARRLLQLPEADAPTLASALRAAGAQAAAITGSDLPHAEGWALDWVDTPDTRGWLALPWQNHPHRRGSSSTFASAAAAALARGFVTADALVLAKMATAYALRHGYAAGQGTGTALAQAGFASDARYLPFMSWDAAPDFGACQPWPAPAAAPLLPGQPCALYAIVDSAARVQQALAAGVRLLQLRIKTPDSPGEAWHAHLRAELAQALDACRQAGATLVINDHWQRALELAAGDVRHLALHLGQEDLQALGPQGRSALLTSGVRLGISSHSLWELARARSLHPWYVACGPVWPTLTKAMPWRPQGLGNLAWWVHMAGCPVVAIGGILHHAQASQAASTGARAVCVVRGLGDDMASTVPAWQAAIAHGLAQAPQAAPDWPQPSLDNGLGIAPDT